jgi:hypothetical protein
MMLLAASGGASNPFTGLTLTLAGASLPSNQRANPPASTSTYTSAGSVLPADATYSAGYVYFNIYPGTYTVQIKGAEGSGSQHGFGATINATMVSSVTARMIALIGQAGSGNYSAGGMSALALSAGGNTYTGATPILIAGGGGGGYSTLQPEGDGGGTSWSPTTRRGINTDCPTYGGGVYDAGAPFNPSFHTVSIYSCTVGSGAAQAFLSGALGGTVTSCGSAEQGGFGGGGGSCPGGGGGYYGGLAGGNSPSQQGGGGGTSYRLTSGGVYISAWSDGSLNGSSRNANPGTAHGFISIVKV